MINEFYSAMLNHTPSGNQPGNDYVSPEWYPRQVDSRVESLRRSLLLDPSSPVAANWRCHQIRRLLEKSDLMGITTSLDHRTGYLLDELIGEMSALFRPNVFSTTSESVSVQGKFRADKYTISQWKVDVGPAAWTLTASKKSLTGTIGGETKTRVPLPGTDAHVSIPLTQEAEYTISWAAAPQVSLGDTAAEIRTSKSGSVDYLRQADSVFTPDQTGLLSSIVKGPEEDAACVVASSLLVVGHTLSTTQAAEA